MSDWKDDIPTQILTRGKNYYIDGSVSDLEREGNNYTATVEGSEYYYVSITLSGGKVKHTSCTCPYAVDHNYCKHITAVLYEMEEKWGKKIFTVIDEKKNAENRKKYISLTFEDDGKYHYLNFGKSLEEYGATEETIREAEEMYHSGAVTSRNARIMNSSVSERELVYSVRVEDKEKDDEALVSVTLDKSGIKSISCAKINSWYYYSTPIRPECGIVRADRTGTFVLCVHKAAALLSLFDYLKENRDIIDHSDTTALDFIYSFRRNAGKNTEHESSVYTVDIEPSVYPSLTVMTLKVSGSNGKYYKVRDIDKFINTVTSKLRHTISKDNEIDFSSVTLSGRAEKVIKVAQAALVQNLLRRDSSYSRREKDRIEITKVLDDFYTEMKDCVVYLEPGKEKLTFSEARPSFTMRIDEKTEGSHTIGIKVSGKVTKGRETARYLYWVEGNTLLRTEKKNLGSASQFIRVADSSGNFSFTVGMGHIDSFYQRILPELRKAGKIEDNAEKNLSGVLKEAPTALFYVDSVNDHIVLSARFRYDGKEMTLYPSYGYFNERRSTLCTDFQNEISSFLDDVFKGKYTEKGEWILNEDDDSVYSFYHGGLESLSDRGEVFVTDRVKAVVRHLPPLSSSLEIDEKDDSILNFNIDLGGLSIEELVAILESYRSRRKYHRLKNGDFVSLEDVSLDALADIFLSSGLSIRDFTEGKMHLPLYRALYLNEILKEQNGVSYEGGNRLKKLIKEFKTISESDYIVPSALEKTMRSYQKDGYRWMRVLFDHGFGGILADDMGLGKTLQALALLESFKEEGKEVRALIVSPASLVYNWKAEAGKFTPGLSVRTVTGTVKEREGVIQDWKHYDILITSYDLLKRDIALYEGKKFNIEIIDEAQFIKNHNTAAAKAVRAVSSSHRLALTGTPIENRLSELWSIFEYLMPGFLFSAESFRKNISSPIEKNGDTEAAGKLKKLTAPFILRRLKKDVLKDLPEKIEETRVTPLEGEQKKLYTAEVAKTKGMLKESGNYNEKKIEILAQLMRIRQICCDPSLVFEDYKGESSKRTAVMDLIEAAIDGGHRILLFSQFTSMLALLEDDLAGKGIGYYKITGETGKAKRLELVDAFNTGTVPLFLISLKAGGTGLNLTGADIVIHYDPWWNTAAQDQATDRAHRIGQTRRVTVYRMIAEDTIEEKILKLQETKKNLADDIVSGDNISLSSLSKEDLMDLLSISRMG